MNHTPKTLALKMIALPALSLAIAASASAQACCPSDGHTAPRVASTGLGQSAPVAANLAVDPAYRVYAFRRDGVDYLQVNDVSGNVRAAVGSIGGTTWVMPVGSDVARVSVLATPSTDTQGAIIYQTSSLVIRVRKVDAGDTWTIAPAGN